MCESFKVKQIKVLLGVLSAGLIAGFLFALLLLYYYNPTASYQAKNVLLDTNNAYSLRFIEPGPKAKSEGRYVFEGVYFSYFDPYDKKNKTLNISKEKYEQLYQLLVQDNSLVDLDREIQNLFKLAPQAILALKVRSVGEGTSRGIESNFSEIDFINGGDYYRIQLRQSMPGPVWIYFYHPHIYQEVLNLFTQVL